MVNDRKDINPSTANLAIPSCSDPSFFLVNGRNLCPWPCTGTKITKSRGQNSNAIEVLVVIKFATYLWFAIFGHLNFSFVYCSSAMGFLYQQAF